MTLKLEQTQHQAISQKMVQSVTILQMSTQELAEYIKNMALENPVIEFSEDTAGPKEDERIRKLEWLADLDEQNRMYYQFDREDEENDAGMNNLSENTGECLEEFLRMQLWGGNYSETEWKIFAYVIDNLDLNGYFSIPAPEVAQKCGATEQETEHCLEIMRSLEPAGICAENLVQCLLIQMKKQRNQEPGTSMIQNYLDLLGKNQLHIIAQKLKVDISQVAEAAQQIRNLNPKPACGFDTGGWMHYIVPDITVVKFSEQFEILLNDYACPSLRLNQDYLRMLKSDCDRSVKEYLLNHVRQAEEIQNCIFRRNSTLLELVTCIVDVQRHFFLTGDKHLRPLRMRDAAEQIGCHESTVSRAVKDKYLQCCWGVFPLSFFFPKSAGEQESGRELAVSEVKERLKNLIGQEDKKKPYSDQKIAELLKKEGIDLSRRTVVKYREELLIPNSRERKIYNT